MFVEFQDGIPDSLISRQAIFRLALEVMRIQYICLLCEAMISFIESEEKLENQFLNSEEISELLRLPEKTVTQLAREGVIPGKKYGKHWRFLLSDVIVSHRESAVLADKEDLNGSTTSKGQSSLYDRHLLPQRKRKAKAIPPFSWDRCLFEGGAEAGKEDEKRA